MDIIVTTPKSEIKNAAREAQDALAGKVEYYFRAFSTLPSYLYKNDKVYYVENGFITGFALVDSIEPNGIGNRCLTTGKEWNSHRVNMRCDSWKWIKPIPMKGFQGFRYIAGQVWSDQIKIVGSWIDPRPV
jgi:hypothetical protein